MDNLTHALVGVLAADVVLTARRLAGRPPHGSAAVALVLSSILANNAPDLDIVMTPLTGGNLGYLLHHRGHTHTFAFTPLMVLVTIALTWIGVKVARAKLTRIDWLWVLALAVAGQVLHVGADALNNYGVHPFWPLDNGWYYLDAIFIMEPWGWLTLLPLLAAGATRRWSRWLCGILALACLALAAFSGFVPIPIVAALVVHAATLYWVARRWPLARLPLAGAVLAVVLALFLAVTARVERQYHASYGAEATRLDLVRSPFPANPFCWMVIAVESEGEALATHHGVWAPFPSVMTADACPDAPVGGSLLAETTRESHAMVRWLGRTSQSAAALRHVHGANCGAAAFLRFARVPYLDPETREGELSLRDLRYDRGGDDGFAVVRVPEEPASCPANVPHWTPPRLDLLEP